MHEAILVHEIIVTALATAAGRCERLLEARLKDGAKTTRWITAHGMFWCMEQVKLGCTS